MDRILGKAAVRLEHVAVVEDPIAGPPALHVRPDRVDHAGHIQSWHPIGRHAGTARSSR